MPSKPKQRLEDLPKLVPIPLPLFSIRWRVVKHGSVIKSGGYDTTSVFYEDEARATVDYLNELEQENGGHRQYYAHKVAQ